MGAKDVFDRSTLGAISTNVEFEQLEYTDYTRSNGIKTQLPFLHFDGFPHKSFNLTFGTTAPRKSFSFILLNRHFPPGSTQVRQMHF